ncbi:MAG: lamin tail domain-containing protein [Nanoarchaeota archaeon]|nr:lamin tail domain-containing protein [Nanoarchaeota archaeon]
MLGVKSVLLIVILFSFSSLAIEINELMYDSEGSDNNNEFIEIYFENYLNLSGFIIADESSNDILIEINYINSNYALIVEEGFNNTNFNASIYSAGATIGNGLGNDGDEITLFDTNNSVIDSVNYLAEWGADGNGKTLEKNKDGEWKESLLEGGTPGRENSVYDFSYDYSALEITEFMPDPLDNDDLAKPLGEWVELYNSGENVVYLGGLVLYDNYDDHELRVTSVNVENLELCVGCYTVVYRDSDGDFELNNNLEDEVRLYNGYPVVESVLIDEVSFSDAVEGTSWGKFSGGWFKVAPTPGEENVYTAGCDWKLELEMSNSIFQGEDLEFNVTVQREYGEAEEISVKGKIEDVFGGLVKEYSPWTDTVVTTERTKGYTPNLEEGIYQISFLLEGLSCSDQELNDNQVTKLIAINPQYKELDSSLSIESLYLGNDEEVEWGDQFRAEIKIYKGSESKYSVQLYLEKGGEKISTTTKFSLYDEYKDYTLTLPIQLIHNCNQKVEDGQATLVLEAFDLRAEKELEVVDVDEEVCKDYLDYLKEIEKAVEKEVKANAYEIVELPSSVFPEELFKVKVQLVGDAKEHDYNIWSYLYRGSKCYSCQDGERESNLQQIKLRENEIKIVELLMKADLEMEEGEYKLKVKLNKDGQKTDKEMTESIFVEVEEEVKKEEQVVSLASEEGGLELSSPLSSKSRMGSSLTGGVVVYESSSEKARELIPYILVVTFILLMIVVLWKK